ncbi:hypothetical protein [Agrobacterium tumefaciens]|uniref:gp53-like domain-containing protein n=1 Tax=Agrobacterium tumefaciens TaxID=358 RepID=UPI0021D0F76A|nr:hypothetical protein [Agrobacterium tumefaciens]UXT99927.1 hypothetical protein FY129_20980 [Agrobacterium tumefaciens]
MTAPYTAGTIDLVSGSAAVVGTDTAWEISLIIGGTIYVEFDGGNPMPIATVDGDTEITAALKWTGPTGTYSYAIMRDTAYGQQTVANAQALATYIQRLNNPALAATAGVTPGADKLLLFTGPNSATAIDLEELLAMGPGVVGPEVSVAGYLAAFAGADGKTLKQQALSAFVATMLDDPDGATMWNSMGGATWGDGSNGGVRLPNGIIFQWGLVPSLDSSGGASIAYPQAFPNFIFGFYPVVLTEWVSGAHSPIVYQSWNWDASTRNGQTIWCRAGGAPLIAANVRWFAVGR